MSDAPAAVIETTEPLPGPSVDILSTLTDTQRTQWKQTGDLPTDHPAHDAGTETAAEPEPTTPSEPIAPDASAPAPPAKTAKPRTDINARLGQMAEQKRLAVERAEKAERALETLRTRPVAPTAPPVQPVVPAPQAPAYLDLVKRYQTHPNWPTLDVAQAAGFDDPYAAMTAAQSAFIQQAQIAEHAQWSALQAKVTRENAKIAEAFDAARKLEGFKEEALAFPCPPALAETIFESDLSGPLLYYFSEHPTEGRAIAAMEPLAAARAVGKLEAQLSAVSSTPATSPSKTVSSAPDPMLTLGARHTASGDDIEDAIRSNDVSRYMQLANERDLAIRKGGRR
jgi:hypothetical protein